MNTIPEKFPVWQTAMDALDYCWDRRRLMERYGLIPVVITVLSSWSLLALGVSQSEPSAGMFAVLIIQMLVMLPPTVSWYRIVVYGEQAAARPMFTFTRLEVRLLLWQIVATMALLLGGAVAFLVIAGIGAGVREAAGEPAAIALVFVPMGLAALVFLILIATRLSMVYALAALDTPVSFGIAWALTKHIAWRLTAAAIVITLAIILLGAFSELVAWIVGAGIAIIRGSEISAVVPYVRVAVQQPVSMIWLFGIATLFGLVYKSRVETLPAPMDPPAPDYIA